MFARWCKRFLAGRTGHLNSIDDSLDIGQVPESTKRPLPGTHWPPGPIFRPAGQAH